MPWHAGRVVGDECEVEGKCSGISGMGWGEMIGQGAVISLRGLGVPIFYRLFAPKLIHHSYIHSHIQFFTISATEWVITLSKAVP